MRSIGRGSMESRASASPQARRRRRSSWRRSSTPSPLATLSAWKPSRRSRRACSSPCRATSGNSTKRPARRLNKPSGPGMAVYTDIAVEELQAHLGDYDLGELLAYKGIAEGVENSNYLLHTSRGNFILTLYEKRVAAADVPFFLSLLEHLAARGLTCPQPIKTRQGAALGRLAGRPAAIF